MKNKWMSDKLKSHSFYRIFLIFFAILILVGLFHNYHYHLWEIPFTPILKCQKRIWELFNLILGWHTPLIFIKFQDRLVGSFNEHSSTQLSPTYHLLWFFFTRKGQEQRVDLIFIPHSTLYKSADYGIDITTLYHCTVAVHYSITLT